MPPWDDDQENKGLRGRVVVGVLGDYRECSTLQSLVKDVPNHLESVASDELSASTTATISLAVVSGCGAVGGTVPVPDRDATRHH